MQALLLLLLLVAAAGLGCVNGVRIVIDENVGPEARLDPESCQFASKFCPNDSCLREMYWCDGYEDCDDNFDEKNCTQCAESAFKCDNVCISNKLKCDGTKDCDDGSDEADCGEIVESRLFHCHDNTTRRLETRCDGWYDCEDESDESHCTKHMCQPGHIYCIPQTERKRGGRGECLPTSYICDGAVYCKNGADEKNCSFDVERVIIPKAGTTAA